MMPVRSFGIRRHSRIAAAMVVAAAALGLASCSSSSSKSAAPPSLSMTNVTVFSAKSATAAPLWIAQEKGFFKQQGLNVKIELGALSGSDLSAVLLGGSAQFIVTIPSSAMLAAQQGAPLRAVAMTASPEVIDLAINSKAAAAAGIPTADSTQSQVLAQISALKGSHLKITTGSAQTDPNIALRYLLKKQGVTVGSDGDVSITPFGQTALQVTAVETGKQDGIASFPPYTIIPKTTVIHLSAVQPLTESAGYYMSTTSSLIKAHPDTVRAMVTAIAQATQYVHSDTAGARTIVTSQLKNIGITNSSEDAQLFSYYSQAAETYPTQSAFRATASLLNSVMSVSLVYSKFVDSSFAADAFKKLGLTVPSS